MVKSRSCVCVYIICCKINDFTVMGPNKRRRALTLVSFPSFLTLGWMVMRWPCLYIYIYKCKERNQWMDVDESSLSLIFFLDFTSAADVYIFFVLSHGCCYLPCIVERIVMTKCFVSLARYTCMCEWLPLLHKISSHQSLRGQSNIGIYKHPFGFCCTGKYCWKRLLLLPWWCVIINIKFHDRCFGINPPTTTEPPYIPYIFILVIWWWGCCERVALLLLRAEIPKNVPQDAVTRAHKRTSCASLKNLSSI